MSTLAPEKKNFQVSYGQIFNILLPRLEYIHLIAEHNVIWREFFAVLANYEYHCTIYMSCIYMEVRIMILSDWCNKSER